MSQRLSGSSRASRVSRPPRAPLPRSDGSPRELWAREDHENGSSYMSGSNRSSSADSSASSSSIGGEMEQAERRCLHSEERLPTPHRGSCTTRGTSRTYTLPATPLYTWWPTSWSFADFLSQNAPPGGGGGALGSSNSGPPSPQSSPLSLTQSQQIVQATLQAMAAGEPSHNAALDASLQAAVAQSARNTSLSLQTMSPASSQSVLYVPYASLSTEALANVWSQYASAPDGRTKEPPQPFGYPALYACGVPTAANASAKPGSPLTRSATPPRRACSPTSPPASPPTAGGGGNTTFSVSSPTSTHGTNATYTLLQPSFRVQSRRAELAAHAPASRRAMGQRSAESVVPRCPSPSRSTSLSRSATPTRTQMLPLTASTMSPSSVTPGSIPPCLPPVPVALYKMASAKAVNNIQRLTLKIVKDEEVLSQYTIPLKGSDMPQSPTINGVSAETIRTLESKELRGPKETTDTKINDTSKMIAEVLLDSNWQDSSLFKEDDPSTRGRRTCDEKCVQGPTHGKFSPRGIAKTRGGTWQTYFALRDSRKASQRSDTETDLNSLSGASSTSMVNLDADGEMPPCCLKTPPPKCCLDDGTEETAPPSTYLPDRSRICVPCRGRRKRRKRRLPRERCPGRPHILCLCKRSKGKKPTYVDKCCCARRLYMNKAVSRWDPRGQLFLKDEPPKGAAAAATALAEALAAAGCCGACFCPSATCPPCPPCAPAAAAAACWCGQPCCVPCCDCPQCNGCTCAVCVPGQPPRPTWVGPPAYLTANGMGDRVPAAGLPSCMAVTGLSEEERVHWDAARAPFQPPCRTPCTRCRSPCRSPRRPYRQAPATVAPA